MMPAALSRIAVVAALPALLAACDSAEDAAPAQPAAVATPAPVLTSAPVQQAAADGSPLAPGTWQIGETATGADAKFVGNDGKALLAVTCDAASKAVSLAVASAAPGNQTFVLQSGGAAARLDTIADGHAEDPHQYAAIAPDAPVFAGFAAAGGTIEVSQPGGATLRVPATSGVRRVFEACR